MLKNFNKLEAKITPKIQELFKELNLTDCSVEVKIKGGKLRPRQIRSKNRTERDKFLSFKIPDSCLGSAPADFYTASRYIVAIYDPKTKVVKLLEFDKEIYSTKL